MEWLLPQESVDATTTPTTNLDDQPTQSSSATKLGYVEVDELPQPWDCDFDLGLGQPSLHSPASQLALMRQRRRQQYRRKGPSCTAEPRAHRHRRTDRRHSPLPVALSQSVRSLPPTLSHHGAEPARQPEYQPQHLHGDSSRPQSPSISCPTINTPEDIPASGHVVLPGTAACVPAKGSDGDVDMSSPDRKPWTAQHDIPSVEKRYDRPQALHPVTNPQPRARPSTIRSEAIRAALALEALRIDNECSSSSTSDGPEKDGSDAITTPGATALEPNTEDDMLKDLPIHREYGLLRVRSASNVAAAPAGNRVLVHSVPRVRKRRLKKLETRLGATDDSPPPTPVVINPDQCGQ